MMLAAYKTSGVVKRSQGGRYFEKGRQNQICKMNNFTTKGNAISSIIVYTKLTNIINLYPYLPLINYRYVKENLIGRDFQNYPYRSRASIKECMTSAQ